MVHFDWQFVAVTLVAMVALAVLVRRLAPARKASGGSKADPACAHCASNPEQRHASPARAPRTTTTPVVSLSDLRETARKR